MLTYCILIPIMALEFTTCFEDITKRTTIFQWDARDLRGSLSDFRQFMHKYRFAVVVSESRIGNYFWLSRCDRFHSDNGTNINSFLPVRKYLPYIFHRIPSHPDNEYVAHIVTFPG